MPRCRFAARFGKLPLAYSLGLVLAACVVLLLPAFALAFVSTGTDGCLCQSPLPPGDPFTVIVLFDSCHGWLAGGLALVTTFCGSEALTTGALAPRAVPGRSLPSAGRPRPATRQVRVREGRKAPASSGVGRRARLPAIASSSQPNRGAPARASFPIAAASAQAKEGG